MGGSHVCWVQLRGLRERLHGGVIAHHELQHGGQKFRVGRCRAQRFRADSRFGQELAEPPGLAGNEGQRLNRNDFSDFAWVVEQAFSTDGLPFR